MKQYGIDDAEHRRIGADAQGQSDDRNRRKPRRLPQHAETIANILK
jgi:hypothetical protein